MRYSVVLPRIEPNDTDDARRALHRAHALWEKGEQRAALDLVRQASESADAAGQQARAVALSRAVATLSRAISPSQFPSHSSEKPPLPDRESLKQRAHPTAVTAAPPSGAPATVRETVPAKKPRPAADGASLSPESGPVRYGRPNEPARAPAVSGATRKAFAAERPEVVSGSALAAVSPPREVVISSPPAEEVPLPRANATVASTPSPVEHARTSATAGLASSAPTSQSFGDAAEDGELIVTIAPSDWALASPNALVGHRAQRVAVAPGRGPGGTMMVRPLAPGEVAPRGSVVAVMVALEPGALPLPRAG